MAGFREEFIPEDRLVSAARDEANAASAELGGLSTRLEDCESQLEFINDAVDALLETTDELVVFVGANGEVEGVSDVVAQIAAVPADELAGRRFAEVAERLVMPGLVSAVRTAIAGTATEDVDLGQWRVSIRPVDGAGAGAVVVGRRND